MCDRHNLILRIEYFDSFFYFYSFSLFPTFLLFAWKSLGERRAALGSVCLVGRRSSSKSSSGIIIIIMIVVVALLKRMDVIYVILCVFLELKIYIKYYDFSFFSLCVFIIRCSSFCIKIRAECRRDATRLCRVPAASFNVINLHLAYARPAIRVTQSTQNLELAANDWVSSVATTRWWRQRRRRHSMQNIFI